MAMAVMSHWYTLLENLQASPMDFYASVEAAIKKRQIPGASTSRVEWHEGGAFSGRREYLRVSREGHLFDICGAPFGTGFFVSWRLSEAPIQLEGGQWLLVALAIISFFGIFRAAAGVLGAMFLFVIVLGVAYAYFHTVATRGSQELNAKILNIPVLGLLYEALFHPLSYYRIDTALMFQESIRFSVQEVVDEITKAKGIRALSELERKPILKDLFQR
jgi:hypothetical protein